MKQLVIIAGGFHPFHAGHLALYQSAEQAFPGADVKVAATNDTSARPFPFKLKEKLAQLAGVPPGKFYQVKSPFRADEITKSYDPATTQLIFVRSEKDATKPPVAGAIKKDGTPAYLQPISDDMAPMTQHAYMAYLPTVEFGPGMTSATEIRSAWPTLSTKRKTALVMSLYPATQSNPKLAANVVDMLDTAMGAEAQDMAEVNEASDQAAVDALIKKHGWNMGRTVNGDLAFTWQGSKYVFYGERMRITLPDDRSISVVWGQKPDWQGRGTDELSFAQAVQNKLLTFDLPIWQALDRGQLTDSQAMQKFKAENERQAREAIAQGVNEANDTADYLDESR